ncbi:hypothetical protein O6H91_01G006700 [Diphasiastrum complanatum]|uniref:Uncharacterized protein n=1 Tax=Diphasiastrum complanatum TaxID=34168 RepID=A0ACC2EML6_DIPCM|nr:hypothetical protein O6H91_01G006700 [Diphasiastrum complanatum]
MALYCFTLAVGMRNQKTRSENNWQSVHTLPDNRDHCQSTFHRTKSDFFRGSFAFTADEGSELVGNLNEGKLFLAANSFEGGLSSELSMNTSLPRVRSPHGVPSHASLQSTVLPAQSPAIGSQINSLPSNLLVECLEIHGGSPLRGHVEISGAKNSALAVLAGALCTSEEVHLRMVPDLHDIRRMFQVLQSIGVKLRQDSSEIVVDARNITSVEPCPDVGRKLRASFFVIGALLGRQGEAVVPLPGGCNIGARPIDLHVRGLEALGATVEIRQGKVHAHVANGKKLVGGRFCLKYPSVGATETLMMAASLADGETVLSNVAQEPEVVHLAEFLKSCGANIEGAGTNTLAIKGVNKLHGSDFTIIPDRIEAGTFLIAAAITRSAISMSRVIPQHLASVIGKLESIGCVIEPTYPTCLKISASQHLKRSCLTKTQPFPGFPTDLQPQFMSLLTTCYGQSIIEETVFESRMRHVEELQKLGAKIKVRKNMAFISGCDQGSSLYGAPVIATDLRAGASLVLAGIAAEGTTRIEGVSHIDRGYEKFDEKLRAIGANIQRKPCLPSELTI